MRHDDHNARATAATGIVLIGRNEGARLVACLKSIARTTSPIVYVDSGSIDGSVETARSHGALVVELDRSRPFTAASARNAGAAHLLSRHPDLEFMQFVDGDCTLDSDWLTKARDFMSENPGVAAVAGRRRERDMAASLYNQLCDIEWDTPIGQTQSCGGDSLIRAAAFQQVGGFTGSLIAGEEPELCLRLRAIGWKIWRLDADMTFHDAAINRFGQWWRRSARGGYAMAEVVSLRWTGPGTMWLKPLLSAFAWGLFLPIGLLAATLCWPISLLGALAYPAQMVRIAMKRGADERVSWAYSAFMVIAKFAEVQGAMTYYWRAATRQQSTLIEYK